jgi:outer membrane protein OmpA-like peptidoglycan-associated protein
MKTKSMRASALLATSAALMAGLAGCAARQNMALERARANYETAEMSPQVQTYAKPELVQAGASLKDAEIAFKQDEPQSEVSHLALVADKQTDIARSKATERSTLAANQTMAEQRDALAAAAAAQRTELEVRLAELQARETERGLVVTLGDVLFETDKAELRAGAVTKLQQLVAVMRENPDRSVLIEGHADARGSDSYNLDLSQRRAQSVRSFMLANGVDPGRVVATGYGEQYPVAPNTTVEGQTMNRRVEVVLLKPGESPRVSSVTVVR